MSDTPVDADGPRLRLTGTEDGPGPARTTTLMAIVSLGSAHHPTPNPTQHMMASPDSSGS